MLRLICRRPRRRQTSPKLAKTAPSAQLSVAEAVARANAWLDAARTITADFVQIGPNGKRSEGQLSVARPGRMLFQYTAPARFEIVADGRSVAVVDHKLNTQDEFFIAQTPLKFLLADHIDIARDTRVLSVAQDRSSVSIEIEDKAALGGTAHLELIFDPVTFALNQWTVIDAQGFQTVVTLFNVDLKTKPDLGAVPYRREFAFQRAWRREAVTALDCGKAIAGPGGTRARLGIVAFSKSPGRP